MKKVILVLGFINSLITYGQSDTIISYNINTHVIDTIVPVTYDTTITFDHTGFSVGIVGNQTGLSQTPPATNLLGNTNFSNLANASDFFNVTNYPIRTTAKVLMYKNGIESTLCSGIMISTNMLLTASFNLYSQSTKTWVDFDSLVVAPAYDDASLQNMLPKCSIDKAYIFKTFYDNKGLVVPCLLQLNKHIGIEIGFVGIAFTQDTSYYSNKVFHKFSYAALSPLDTLTCFNGDTLLYNYGKINALSNNNIGLALGGANGRYGQGGTTFLYTNNIDAYYCFGLFTYASGYNHLVIKPKSFYQLKNIIDTHLTSGIDETKSETAVTIYPNPFVQKAILTFSNSEHQIYSMEIFNGKGQLIERIDNIKTNTVDIQKNGKPAGLYFYQLTSNQLAFRGKFIIE